MEDSEKKSVQVTTYLPKEVLEQLKKWMDDAFGEKKIRKSFLADLFLPMNNLVVHKIS